MKILSLKKPWQFKKVKNSGLSFSARSLTIATVSNDNIENSDCDTNNPSSINKNHDKTSSHCNIGIIATKMLGKAYKRNFAKRRIRAIINKIKLEKQAISMLKANNYYVVIAKKPMIEQDFTIIYNDFKYCLNGLRKMENKDSHGNGNMFKY